VLAAYGFDMVVVPVEVVSVSGMAVSTTGGCAGLVSPDVMSVVLGAALGVLVLVVVLCAADVVVVVVVEPGTSVTDGVVECRDVCKTAKTSTAITASPAPPAANTAPRRSYHCVASGSVGRSSVW
jgi:hypothetical protein